MRTAWRRGLPLAWRNRAGFPGKGGRAQALAALGCEPGAWGLGPGTWSLGPVTRPLEPLAWAKGLEPRAWTL